jgi:hypothetical protein
MPSLGCCLVLLVLLLDGSSECRFCSLVVGRTDFVVVSNSGGGCFRTPVLLGDDDDDDDFDVSVGIEDDDDDDDSDFELLGHCHCQFDCRCCRCVLLLVLSTPLTSSHGN